MQNLKKIRPDYYEHKLLTHEPWLARRLLENRPGYSRHGLPVHDHFDIMRMVTEHSFKAVEGLPLVFGADCGNTMCPAAVALQRAMRQVRAVGEVFTPTQMDLTEFGQELRRQRETEFGHVSDAWVVCDPSAVTQSVLRRGVSLAAILQAESGMEVLLAPTNDPLARRGAMDQVLKRNAGPGEPGLLCSGPDTPGFVKAMAGGYHFAKKGDKRAPLPNKVHPHADLAEAGQYGVLGLEGFGSAMAGLIHDDMRQRDSQDLRPILQE